MDLNKFLEDANTHPQDSMEHLTYLNEQCEEVLLKEDLLEQFFVPNKTDDEVQEMVETFMQNALLLIDNCFDVQHIMMSILADLCVIEYKDFGIKCFATLKDLMKSGKELEAYVISVMQERVINTLTGPDPYDIPVALLQGLHELIEETEDSEMLTPMFDNNFPTWIKAYEKKVLAAKK